MEPIKNILLQLSSHGLFIPIISMYSRSKSKIVITIAQICGLKNIVKDVATNLTWIVELCSKELWNKLNLDFFYGWSSNFTTVKFPELSDIESSSFVIFEGKNYIQKVEICEVLTMTTLRCLLTDKEHGKFYSSIETLWYCWSYPSGIPNMINN